MQPPSIGGLDDQFVYAPRLDNLGTTYPALIGLEASEQRAKELHERAVASLEPLGDNAQTLRLLSEFIVHRNRIVIQYNWLYLAALAVAGLSFTPLGLIAGAGDRLAGLFDPW